MLKIPRPDALRIPHRLTELRKAMDAGDREDGGHARIEVSDARGERLPEARNAGTGEDGGRGLLLVAALAEEWRTAPRPGPPPARRCGPWHPPYRSAGEPR
ncbi:hypothetical protein FHS32_000889 [Streptomyces albaduncus]|uniref:ATP-binding protein n=1 Tax=Streptomyces griseoloalbus TaxID=67303 RepID=A0A7W8BIX2_9ACTN|nr:hypothetical protein [Streptomyces albaduncus]GGW33048.1 hypothetical protein GCM10010340_08420 [Streptomyces albaduncus]